MIAIEAGISGGPFYRSFKSKNERFPLLIQEVMGELLCVMDSLNHISVTSKEKIRYREGRE